MVAEVFVWGTNEHAALALPREVGTGNEVHRILAVRSHFVRGAATIAGRSMCATASGELLSWGGRNARLPQRMLGPADVATLGCTDTHVFALTDAGDVYSCMFGREAVDWPRVAVEIVRLACGEAHCLALDENGGLFSWGRGTQGQLGLGKVVENVQSPTRVTSLPQPAAMVACGAAHSMLLTNSGELLGCGVRECLVGHEWSRQGVQPGFATLDATGATPGETATAVCGRAHTLVLTGEGKLFSFGRGEAGQLGHGSAPCGRALRVGGPLATRTVSAVWGSAADQSFALTSDGCFFFWGAPPVDGASPVPVPEEMPELNGVSISLVSACSTHVLAISSGGDAFAWGDGGECAAALGLQTLGAVDSPRAHPLLSSRRVRQLSCGDGPHCLALLHADSGGGVLAWGRNSHGELGRGGGGGGPPTLVDSGALAKRTTPLTQVAAGGHFSLVCGSGSEGDELFGWGSAAAAQLGKADLVSSRECDDGVCWSPVKLSHIVSGAAWIAQLCAGWQHAGIIICDEPVGESRRSRAAAAGVALLWGCDQGGALGAGGDDGSAGGDGGSGGPSAPAGSLTDAAVRLLSCGREASAAVDSNGNLHVWGRFADSSEIRPQLLALPPEMPSSITVTHLCCAGRRLLFLCSARLDHTQHRDRLESQTSSSILFECTKGKVRKLSVLDGLQANEIGSDGETLFIQTEQGRLLRTSLSAGAKRREVVALPGDATAQLLSVGRTHGAVAADCAAELFDRNSLLTRSLSPAVSVSSPMRPGSARPCWLQPSSQPQEKARTSITR